MGALGVFEDGAKVDAEALAAKGLIRKRARPVKILGGGSLERRLEVVADSFSASARRKIEEAKGTATPAAGKKG